MHWMARNISASIMKIVCHSSLPMACRFCFSPLMVWLEISMQLFEMKWNTGNAAVFLCAWSFVFHYYRLLNIYCPIVLDADFNSFDIFPIWCGVSLKITTAMNGAVGWAVIQCGYRFAMHYEINCLEKNDFVFYEPLFCPGKNEMIQIKKGEISWKTKRFQLNCHKLLGFI